MSMLNQQFEALRLQKKRLQIAGDLDSKSQDRIDAELGELQRRHQTLIDNCGAYKRKTPLYTLVARYEWANTPAATE